MNIPEITETQLRMMQEVCSDPNMSVFSQTSSKEGDAPEAYAALTQGQLDADYLCTLGFLKNITENHLERLASICTQTGRTWRVFEVTAMGRAMFQVQTPSIHN